LNTQVLGISVDPIPTLKAWAESFGGINYPLLSDFWPHGEIASRFGVLTSEGVTERALFLIDKQGIIQYIDIHDPDDQPDNNVLFKQIRSIDPDAKAEEKMHTEHIDLPRGGIVMYCSKWCVDCRKARAWFGEQGLEITEVDVYETPGALEQVREWGDGYLITPTFDIDGEIVLDFDQDRLVQILGL
jgi:glutaredoxin